MIAVWGWAIVSALIRRGKRATGRRESSSLAAKSLAASPPTEPAALPQEPSKRRLETAAAWTQIIALPLAVLGLVYAGLAYTRQADDAQQALSAIQVQQQLLTTQESTIEEQVKALSATAQGTEDQQQLLTAVRQLTTVEKQLAALNKGKP
jgi:hypothetical protein